MLYLISFTLIGYMLQNYNKNLTNPGRFDVHIFGEILGNTDVYRVFITKGGAVEHVFAYDAADPYQTLFLGKVDQIFPNQRAIMKSESGSYAYVDGKFCGRALTLGEHVWVQFSAVAVLDVGGKYTKGILDISLPCGPLILYPQSPGLKVSYRLKPHTEELNRITELFKNKLSDMGLKLRLQCLEFSDQELLGIFDYLQRCWNNKHVSGVQLMLNDLMPYLKSIGTLHTNSQGVAEVIQQMKKDIFQSDLTIQRIQKLDDDLEDAWDTTSSLQFELKGGGNVCLHDTKACVTIDVNAGNTTQFDQVNLEAIRLLPRILHQGKWGGKVVVDLLPMGAGFQKTVLNEFHQRCVAVGLSPQIFGISKMGMLEFILPRRGFPLYFLNKKMKTVK